MLTLSIPLSSFCKSCRKSETVEVIGRRVKRHRSRREGRGTVITGRPRW
ncbi:hypothetical protein X975_10763, partial [Stegodyphus mimosarum]